MARRFRVTSCTFVAIDGHQGNLRFLVSLVLIDLGSVLLDGTEVNLICLN